MAKRNGWLIAYALAAGCGSSAGVMPGSDGGMPGSGGAGNFAGTYACTLNETATLDGSQPFPVSTTSTITFKDGTSTDMIETLTGGGAQSCSFTYNRTGDSASAVPADQSCMYVLANGNHQTNTDSLHMATVSGSTVTINLSGKYVGTTTGGTPYGGTFQGAWTCKRQ
jgi:hypothetical protein